jgi:hypothetical protein
LERRQLPFLKMEIAKVCAGSLFPQRRSVAPTLDYVVPGHL